MSFLFELVLILGVGVFLLRPEDFPLFMRFLGRCIVKIRQWRRVWEAQVEKVIRDIEVEDFKQDSYRLYEENVRKVLGVARNALKSKED